MEHEENKEDYYQKEEEKQPEELPDLQPGMHRASCSDPTCHKQRCKNWIRYYHRHITDLVVRYAETGDATRIDVIKIFDSKRVSYINSLGWDSMRFKGNALVLLV